MSFRLGAALLVLALVAAACDGDGTSETTTATVPASTTTTESATTTTRAVQAGDPRCDASWTVQERDDCNAVAAMQSPVQPTTSTCEVVPRQIITTATPGLVDAVLSASPLAGEARVERSEQIPGLPLNLVGLADTFPPGAEADAALALRVLGIPATPHYIVIPSPSWKWGPGDDAVPAPAGLVDPPGPPAAPEGVVTVIDTGLPGTPNQVGVEFSALQPSDEVEPDGLDLHYRGHGLFVAGVVRQEAPDAEIVVRSPYPKDAEDFPIPRASELEVWRTMLEAQTNELNAGGVLNISGGTYSCGAEDAPLLLAAATAHLFDKDIVIVASSGNDSLLPDPAVPVVSNVMYPAGFAEEEAVQGLLAGGFDAASLKSAVAAATDDDVADTEALFNDLSTLLEPSINTAFGHVVGVGAADDSGAPAGFSNQTAVSLYEVGVDVISNYPSNATWGSVNSTGAVVWSGTSFAAPKVSGRIVAQLAGGTYRDAAAAIVP